MTDEHAELELGTICDGAVVEMFKTALSKILASLADPNVPAIAKRKWTLTLEVSCRNDKRSEIALGVSDKVAIPSREKYLASAYLRSDMNDRLVLLGPVGEQISLDLKTN